MQAANPVASVGKVSRFCSFAGVPISAHRLRGNDDGSETGETVTKLLNLLHSAILTKITHQFAILS